MAVIHKFDLGSPDTYNKATAIIPMDAKFVKAGIQEGNHLCVWYQVDTQEERLVEKNFIIMGTGDRLPSYPYFKHLESVFHGAHVWHLFVVP